jgi:hypothetical protein
LFLDITFWALTEVFYVKNNDTNLIYSAGSNQEKCLSRNGNEKSFELIELEDQLSKGEEFVHFDGGCRHVNLFIFKISFFLEYYFFFLLKKGDWFNKFR